MSEQLKIWQGDFGDAYTERNPVDWRIRMPAFQQMLAGLSIERVLEVGCNRGHNLIALAELLDEDCEIVGLEPNQSAWLLSRDSSPNVGVLRGDVSDLCFRDRYFDLVFTVGVLIHVSLIDLTLAMSELYRVSRRYILAVEYFSESETSIYYRGHNELLWKRDFLNHFRTQFPDLNLIRSGVWGSGDGFDNHHWWLLQKPAEPPKA